MEADSILYIPRLTSYKEWQLNRLREGLGVASEEYIADLNPNITPPGILRTLSKQKFAPVAAQTLIKPKTSDEEIYLRVYDSMFALAEKVERELRLPEGTIKNNIPKVCSFEEAVKDTLAIKILEKLPENARKEIPARLLDDCNTDPERERTTSPDTIGAYFVGSKNLAVDTGLIKKFMESGIMTPEEIGTHEGNHIINSILRSMLPPELLHEAVKSFLVGEVIYGPTLVTRPDYSTLSQIMPFKEMRNELANILGGLLDSVGEDVQDKRLEKKTVKTFFGTKKITVLSEEGIKELNNLVCKNECYLQLFDNNPEDATYVLKKYVEYQISRYEDVLKKVIQEDEKPTKITIPRDNLSFPNDFNIENYKKAKEKAFESAKNVILFIEGNRISTIQRSLGKEDEEAAFGYWFAPEETECELRCLCAKAVSLDTQEEYAQISKARIETYGSLESLMDRRRELVMAEQDTDKAVEVNKLKVTKKRISDCDSSIEHLLQEIRETIAANPDKSMEDLRLLLDESIAQCIKASTKIMSNNGLNTLSNAKDELDLLHEVRKKVLETARMLGLSNKVNLDLLESELEKIKLYRERAESQEKFLYNTYRFTGRDWLDTRNRLIKTRKNMELIKEVERAEKKFEDATRNAGFYEVTNAMNQANNMRLEISL